MRFDCPICEMSNSSQLVYAFQEGLSIRQCVGCGLVHTDPFPSGEVYEEDYFLDHYVSRQNELNVYYVDILDRLAKHQVESGRLLDVGCGIGLLLGLARRRGFEVKGVEFSPWAAQYAREQWMLDVKTGTLEDACYPTSHFNVVVINHVLEHIPQPKHTLLEINRILATDGILVVGVPNFSGLASRLRRDKWRGLAPDQHLCHFSQETLSLLLSQTGFMLLDCSTSSAHAVIDRASFRSLVKSLAWETVLHIGDLVGAGDAILVLAQKEIQQG